jgi:Fe-S oxidoreductase/nitrate reductase gamma subunit
MNNATREVFGNISVFMRVIFYAMIAASLVALLLQLHRRYKLWRKGQPGPIEHHWRVIVARLLGEVLLQKRVIRKSLGGVMHLLLFSGFVVLSIGTTLLAIADYGPIHFHHGWYYLIYELTMDIFGVAFCIGCALALFRRAFRRPSALGHAPSDWYLLSLLLALGVSGFLIEALRLHYTQVTPDIGVWSIVGFAVDRTMLQSLSLSTARSAHLFVWWTHAIMVGLFFATIPQTRLLHIITGPLNIALRPNRHRGALVALDPEQIEQTGRIGVSEITHLTRQQLLSLDACMGCGRCEQACPAFASNKPLSPKSLVLDLRRVMQSSDPQLHAGAIAPETLWSCTMCQACVHECPVQIGHVDLIADMRRHLVGEGHISGPPAVAMRGVGSQFNPYGQPNSERFAWADGLDVPTVESNPHFEYLLWVGCSASFDPRAQKVARATAQLLKQAGVNFAVLGSRERCTGDPARRLGDELLFQQLAQENVATLNECKTRKIVTPCPHCMNTLANEYPDFGGKFQVVHHSQLLAELLAAGKLQPAHTHSTVTLHDPCYLARVNGQTESTRQTIDGDLIEMPRNRERTFCCGAGGGRMFFDESPDTRVNKLRAAEARATGATTVATACPFCLNMMTDGIAATPGDQSVKVLDISELLINGQPQVGSKP